jgi:hypothetical protein
MQEVGLRKRDFSESKVGKMSTEPQVPLGGLIENYHFGELVDIMLEDWLLSLMSTLVMGFGPQD